MYLSKFFLPTIKEDPKEASIASHRLMLRAGMMRQLISGIYNWLPLGLRVLKNVEKIVREEMNNADAVEVLLPCIQPVELWKKSGRFDGPANDLTTEMLRIYDRHENQLTFSPTAEEVIAELFNDGVQSYKSLPLNLFQVQWKFRDEIRPRFGVMRCREFLMKDAYSFHVTKDCAINTYQDMMRAYLKSFSRMGLSVVPVKADSGAIGGDYSHEFHVLAETGESKIFIEEGVLNYLKQHNVTLDGISKFYANAEEKHDPANCPVKEQDLIIKRGIEVGHIFYLGDKYSKALNVAVQNNEGKEINPEMGCYGIGVSRLIGAIIEANHDENGIIWPDEVAPFKIGIINLRPQDEVCTNASLELYNAFKSNGVEVLYDDTNDSAGAKFSRMDLIGIPIQITVGPKGVANGTAEVKLRRSGIKEELSLEALKSRLLAA